MNEIFINLVLNNFSKKFLTSCYNDDKTLNNIPDKLWMILVVNIKNNKTFKQYLIDSNKKCDDSQLIKQLKDAARAIILNES